MSYEPINEELGVYSCSISDLTMDQVSSFLKLWNDGSTIGSLTVFYDIDGRIVINEGMKDFEKCKETVIKYLQLSEDEKIEFKESITVETIISILAVLDAAVIYRKKKAEQQALIKKWEPIKIILGNQMPNLGLINELREQFYDGESVHMAISNIYSLGVIQGKREERARRKRNISERMEIKK